MSICLFVSFLVACGELSHGFRIKDNMLSHRGAEHANRMRARDDIQDFAANIFTDVIAPRSEEALSNACSKFGHIDGAGDFIWTLGKPPKNGADEWRCNEAMGGVEGISESQWRQILVENYVYDEYHFIPVKNGDNVSWNQYKHDLMEALKPFKDQVLCDVQGYTGKLLRLAYFFEDPDLMDEVQDYRWMRFYKHPTAYNRRLSINVPTPSRPAFAACAIEKLLIPGKINQMKVHMVHAMETENMSVPMMTSDNIIMYLLKEDDIDDAVQEAQHCLDATVGSFARPGPHLMKPMRKEGGNIYGAADDLTSGLSYGQRLAKIFGEGYLRMLQKDDPGAQDSGCLKQVARALGQLVGAYQPNTVAHDERVTADRFAAGLAGAMEKAGLKSDGLSGLD